MTDFLSVVAQLDIIEHCSGVIEDILGCIWATEPVITQFQQYGQVLCCLVTNKMVTTGKGSDSLPKRTLSDLTGTLGNCFHGIQP
jgi:hypothetical protein